MLVKLPRTGIRVRVPDRHIPSELLDPVLELDGIDAEQAELRRAARARVRETERALVRRMRARLAARAAIESAAAAADLRRHAPELTAMVLDAIEALVGAGGRSAWQSAAAMHIATRLESVAAVDLTVAPDAVAQVEAALVPTGDDPDLRDRIRVIADPSMGAGTCTVRCGDRCWFVDLQAWLNALREQTAERMERLLASRPTDSADLA